MVLLQYLELKYFSLKKDVEEVVQILSSSSLESTSTKREKGEQQKDR